MASPAWRVEDAGWTAHSRGASKSWWVDGLHGRIYRGRDGARLARHPRRIHSAVRHSVYACAWAGGVLIEAGRHTLSLWSAGKESAASRRKTVCSHTTGVASMFRVTFGHDTPRTCTFRLDVFRRSHLPKADNSNFKLDCPAAKSVLFAERVARRPAPRGTPRPMVTPRAPTFC